MRRKRHSLAKRRHRELRRFAEAPLRRFLAKCRSSYHFSIWHTIMPGESCRARLTGETGCSVRKRPGTGREACGERSDVRSWRCCHHLRLLAVTHYRRREVEGGPPSIDVRFRTRCQCRVLAWLGRPRPPRANSPARLLRRLFFDPRGCVRAADQVPRPDSLRVRYPIGLALYAFSASRRGPLRQSAGQQSRWLADRPAPHSMPGSLRNWLHQAGIRRPPASHGP